MHVVLAHGQARAAEREGMLIDKGREDEGLHGLG